jgi:transcriptional regulator with XRE-family HTH domain
MSDRTEAINVRVARRLYDARVTADLTVREAATRTDVDHSQIVKYKNGTHRPPLDRLDMLAHAYGLTLAALLAENDALVPVIAELERAQR